MCRFLKFIPSEEAFWLMKHKPNAFYLLTHIANTARRQLGHPDGLLIGQCHLQSWDKYGFTEGEYRAAKGFLVKRKHIVIIETNRTRKKSTTGTTTQSTLVQLCSSTVYDINIKTNDDRNDDRTTTERRQTRRKKKEEEEKESHPSIPSGRDDGLIDDLSFEKEKIEIIPGVLLTDEELRSCLKVKGNIERVKSAMQFIQNSKKRKHPITDWPNALAKWKIENKTNISKNEAYLEKICKEFAEAKSVQAWQCRKYIDQNKDQMGLLFECHGSQGAQQPFFVARTDSDFESKCEEFIKNKKMRKK